MDTSFRLDVEENTKSFEIQSARRYRHQALNTSTQQIRLIKLHLRNTNRPEFDMSVFELSNAPPFTALSYMWGPPSPRFDITISGKPLGIRENLFRFFETYVRNTENDFLWEYTGPLYLWIDQICIDQSSVSERNHQVGMMASIYSECSNTIIWLGIIPNNPDAPRMIKKMESSSVPEESVIQAVASIIRHDYFTRLWIVQEVILSKWKRVLCSHPSAGAVWVDWDNLAYIARRFQYRLPSTPAKHLVKDHLQEIGLNLVQAVRFFSQGRCHDPRDKVYGLMGLVKEEQRLTIDYAKPLEELLADMTNIFHREMRDTSAYTHTEYQDALLSLVRTWGILSESLIAFLYEVWDKPTYDWHQKFGSNGPASIVYPPICTMGFLPKGPHKNMKLKAKELLPYSMDVERNSGDFKPNDWIPTEDCWWYQTEATYRTEDAIYETYGLVSSDPLHNEYTTPGYYGRRVRKAQQERKIRKLLPSWLGTRRSFQSA